MRALATSAVALCIVIGGAWFDSDYLATTPDPVRTQGKVVGFLRPAARQVHPIVQFTTPDGTIHRVTTPRPQRMVRYASGEDVQIAYARDNPERARIDTLWYDHSGLIVGLGVAATLLAGLVVRRKATRA